MKDRWSQMWIIEEYAADFGCILNAWKSGGKLGTLYVGVELNNKLRNYGNKVENIEV